ncbi:hypothetical protein D3C78_1100810 [compost metagenome]
MHQHHFAGQPRRRGHALLVVEEHVAGVGRVEVLEAVAVAELLPEVHRRVGAVRQRGGLHVVAPRAAATVAGDVVPDHFQAALGDGEGHGRVEVLQAVAAGNQAGADGVAGHGLVDRLGQVGAAVGGEDAQVVAVRVALEQGQLPGTELLAVLLGVLCGDGEQRFFVGEGVGQEARGVGAAAALRQAAGPGGDAAVGVAGLFRADGRERVAEPGRLFGGYRRLGGAGNQGGEGGEDQGGGFHCFVSAQKDTPKLRATKSRSVFTL